MQTEATEWAPDVEQEDKVASALSDIQNTWNRKLRLDVDAQFRIGDIFNEWKFTDGVRKARMVDKFGEDLYRKFRGFGWCAKKWKEPDRAKRGRWSWSKFWSTKPDGTEEEKPASTRTLQIGQVTIQDGGMLYLTAESGGKKRATIRTTKEEVLRKIQEAEDRNDRELRGDDGDDGPEIYSRRLLQFLEG